MKEIKTKQAKKDIKILDKATDVSRRAKNAYIRTKEQSEQYGRNDDSNYVDNAEKNVLEGAETIIRKSGNTAENYGKKAAEKIKERRAEDKDAARSDTHNEDNTRQSPKSEAKETTHRNAAQTETKQTAQQSATPVKAREAAKKKVSQSGVKQATSQNANQFKAKEPVRRKFTLAKPNELAKRRFVQSRMKQQLSQTNAIQMVNQKAVETQARQTSEHIVVQSTQRPLFQPTRRKAMQNIFTSGKTGRTIKQSTKTSATTIKEATKGMVKTAKKTVKTAERTTKTAIKTSRTAAKTAVKTAQATQRAVQTARAAARAAAFSAKIALKVMLATIKAIIMAVKGMITLIAAGGWIAVVIILIICLAGLLLGSVFGVFFSNESSSENMPTMTEVIRQLNEEFTEKIEQIQVENPHDTVELSPGNGNSTIVSNWREILPVYAVKTAADIENGMDVATLDYTKVGILRGIFWDMNQIDYWIESIEHEETITTTDKDGNEIEKSIITTETILHINLISKSHADMNTEYDFNPDQIKMLNELMQDEYQQLFMKLING